jgi:hypothetical protein
MNKQLEIMVYEQTVRDLFSSYGCEVEDVVVREFSINEVCCALHS